MDAQNTTLVETMNREMAEQVTTRIKTLITAIAENTTAVVELIDRARAGEAWKVLGFASWTAYVSSEFSDSLADLRKADRVPIIVTLTATGMSTRAIAPIMGVSRETVRTDLAGDKEPVTSAEDKVHNNVVGLDDKTYPRASRPAQKPRRRRPFPDAYSDAVWELQKAVERIQRLHLDDRFRANRDAVKYHAHLLANTMNLLDDLADELLIDLTCSERGCDHLRVATFDIDARYCSDCRRFHDGVPGPCEYCGAALFTDCKCEVG